jgi:hypothetical protein
MELRAADGLEVGAVIRVKRDLSDAARAAKTD